MYLGRVSFPSKKIFYKGQMTANRKIIAGFGVIIFLLAFMGVVAVFTVFRTAATSQEIYDHPFTVSNAAKDVRIHILTIQRDMKNILLLRDRGQISAVIDQMNRHEKEIERSFQILFGRFLGDIRDVHRLHDIFVEWGVVRNKIIASAEAGRIEEAIQITTTQSAEYADSLSESAKKLAAFAAEKATQFQREARRGERISVLVVVSLLAIILIISLLIAIYVVRNLREGQRELARHLYLVDQNVLVSSLDEGGYVQDISSALCRLLGFTKEEILNKQSDFFVGENNQELLGHILRTLKTGKEWDGVFERLDGEGNPLWLHSTIYPVFDQAYAVSGYNNISENITDKKAIEELSLTDGLTGLHNRRYYENTIEQVIKTARREKKHLTLAILDIDFFKNYNDNYGHPAGDQVLFQIASVFKKLLNRPTDNCMRVGGEEFCIVFTDSDRDKSIEFLEEIRGGIEALKIKHEYSDVHPYVTISAGAVVGLGRDIPDKEQLYRQADEALYKAKKERDKLVVT